MGFLEATGEIDVSVVQFLIFVVVFCVVYSALGESPWDENPIRCIMALAVTGLAIMGVGHGSEPKAVTGGVGGDGETGDVVLVPHGALLVWILWCVVVCVAMWLCDKTWNLGRFFETREGRREEQERGGDKRNGKG